MGPRVECLLPSFVWEQLSLTFPGVPFRIYFIGPESLPPQIQLSTQIAAVPGHRSILPATRVHQRPVTVKDTAEDGVETTRTINSMITPINVNLRME